jgi:hypothetical protein
MNHLSKQPIVIFFYHRLNEQLGLVTRVVTKLISPPKMNLHSHVQACLGLQRSHEQRIITSSLTITNKSEKKEKRRK